MSKCRNGCRSTVNLSLPMRVRSGDIYGPVTSASNSGSVTAQYNQCSLLLITLYNPLNKISENIGPTVKAKQVLKLSSLTDESVIEGFSWNQLILILTAVGIRSAYHATPSFR